MKYLLLLVLPLILGACTAARSAAPAQPEMTPGDSGSPAVPTAPQSAPAPTPSPAYRSGLPDLGAAPELENETWLNVEEPLTLAALRGKVVLLDMWTFG